MTWPVVKVGNLSSDALAIACAPCRRCLTVAVNISPDGHIFEHRIVGGQQHLLLAYWADAPDEPTLAEPGEQEASEVFADVA